MVETGIGLCIGPQPGEQEAYQIKAIPLSQIEGLPAVQREIGLAIHPGLNCGKFRGQFT